MAQAESRLALAERRARCIIHVRKLVDVEQGVDARRVDVRSASQG